MLLIQFFTSRGKWGEYIVKPASVYYDFSLNYVASRYIRFSIVLSPWKYGAFKELKLKEKGRETKDIEPQET